VLSFVRRDAAGGVLAVLNLSREPQDVMLDGALLPGTWTDAFSGEESLVVDDGAQPPSARLALAAGGYRVFTGPGEQR